MASSSVNTKSSAKGGARSCIASGPGGSSSKINNLQRVYLSIPFQIKILTLPDTGNGSPSSRDTGLTGYQLSPELSVLFSSNIVASACAGMLLKSLGSEIRLTL